MTTTTHELAQEQLTWVVAQDPAKKLSQLQKRILGWLLDPGKVYHGAPTGAARAKDAPDFGVTRQALHRAVSRLEARGLLERETFYATIGGKQILPNRWWKLTATGLEIAETVDKKAPAGQLSTVSEP